MAKRQRTLWCHEIAILRATTGVSDVEAGWLGCWLDRQPDARRSIATVLEVIELFVAFGPPPEAARRRTMRR